MKNLEKYRTSVKPRIVAIDLIGRVVFFKNSFDLFILQLLRKSIGEMSQDFLKIRNKVERVILKFFAINETFRLLLFKLFSMKSSMLLNKTKYYQLLTGADNADWSLVVKNNDTEIENAGYTEFYKTDFNNFGTDWKTGLTLPSSWTGQGFDYPVYTGVNAIGRVDGNTGFPTAPIENNPTGLYIKHFTVNDQLYDAKGRIYISLQGVESCYYCYINGYKIGYSEDSYSPHSFDVTDYLNKDGDNILALEVRKYCDGVWTEDQDMFRDGGIFRDIYLYSAPLVHIRDYSVVTDLDENYQNATLNLSVELANASKSVAENYAVDVRLYDKNNNIWLNGTEISFDPIAAADGSTDSTLTASIERTVYSPELWSAEIPNLYTLVLSLYNRETGVYFGSVSQQLFQMTILFKNFCGMM